MSAEQFEIDQRLVEVAEQLKQREFVSDTEAFMQFIRTRSTDLEETVCGLEIIARSTKASPIFLN